MLLLSMISVEMVYDLLQRIRVLKKTIYRHLDLLYIYSDTFTFHFGERH